MGQILFGVVPEMKMPGTVVICQDYLHYIQKYSCFEKCHKNMSVHLSSCFGDIEISDVVTTDKCWPLSKPCALLCSRPAKPLAPGSSSRSCETGHLPTPPKLFSHSKTTINIYYIIFEGQEFGSGLSGWSGLSFFVKLWSKYIDWGYYSHEGLTGAGETLPSIAHLQHADATCCQKT